jgi:hypothetical protein
LYFDDGTYLEGLISIDNANRHDGIDVDEVDEAGFLRSGEVVRNVFDLSRNDERGE